MSTTHRQTSRVADSLGVLAVVLGMVLGLIPGIAPGVADAAHGEFGSLPANQFEIDGNIDGHLDWQGAGGERAADEIDSGNLEDSTWFESSMRESKYGIPGWAFADKGNVPKGDLHRLFAKTQVSPAGSFVWLGATRVADNGNVSVVAEFNKLLPPTEPTARYRSAGDLYITFNFPGSKGATNTQVAISQWPGPNAPDGAYGAAANLVEGVHYRSAVGTITGNADARDFIEIELNLAAIFGDTTLGLECGTFGGVGFRTEVSSGTGDTDGDTTGGTDNSILKDITKPIPLDLDTCASVTVKKVDKEKNPISGAGFTVYTGDRVALINGDGDASPFEVANCSTEADGECSFGELDTGTYTIDETTIPPGYRRDATLPTTFTVVANTPKVLGPYTDPRIDYTIDVAPDGRNAVGNEHTFTVTLEDDTDTGVAGADVDLTWSGAAGDVTSVTPAGPDAEALDCTTDGNGQCTVVVTSSTVGQETLTASWTTPYQNASGDGGAATDGEAVASISDSAAKTWVGYVASIAETATNLVSNGDTAGQHVFTATVKEDDGSGTLTAADGVDVTVTWTGAPDGATISPVSLTCTTNASGQCTFTVDSPTAGAGTITIVGLDGTILGLDDTTDLDDEDLVYDAATPGSEPVAEPGDGNSLTAVKTWREYRALIDGDATNPVGEAHTFNVQVQHREDDGANSWTDAEIAGLTVLWSSPTGVGTVDAAASTCDIGTAADGSCTIVVDTEADDPGNRTVTLLSVTGDLLPGDVPNATDLTYTFDDTQYDATEDEFRAATKTWIEFGANIVSDGHNLVSTDGQPLLGLHEFTVTVWRKPAPGSDATAVPAGTKVTTSIDWDSDLPQPAGLVFANECLDDGTRNVELPGGELASQCTITLNSTVPGVATVTPSGLVGYDYGDGNGTQTVTFAEGNTDDAVKTWYRYRAWIDADSTNLAGDPEGDHDFTVTVEQDSGAGWGPVPNGTTVTVASPDDTNDGSLEDASCTTTTADGASTCTIGVASLAPGSRTVTVGTVEALDVDGDPTVDVSNGDYLEGETQRTAATKTWVSYSATISADATNLTGQDHVFTVEAFVDSGDGPVAAPAGTTLTIDVDAGFLADVADPNTCDGAGTGNQTNPLTEAPAADNECFVTVSSDDVDEVTVTVTHATPAAGTVDGDPTDDITDVDATKTWISVRVDVSDDATNIAGERHAFDVTVTVLSPDDPGGVAAPDGTTVAVTSTGVGRVVEDDETDPTIIGSTCDEGTTGGTGVCTVVVYSAVSGDRSITVDTVTLGGSSFGAIDMDGAEGVASSGNDLDGTKTWRAYRASIASDGLNLVRDEHPFTITIEQTDEPNPTEDDWSEVPDGTTAKVTLAGTGDIVSNDCDAPDGTDGGTGTCTVVVDSAAAGTATVTVSEIGVTHPDDPQVTATVDTANDSATKTWVAFRGSLSSDALNITGDEHVFDVLVEYTTNGTDWDPVPDGSVVTYEAATGTTGSVTADTCDGTTLENEDQPDERVCTITVDTDPDDDAGTRTVTLTGVAAEITVGELTADFDVTFPDEVADEPSGVLDGFDLDDYDATKTWASYTLALDPPAATNLLPTNPDHVITATLATDGDLSVEGEEIQVTLSGDTGTISSVEEGEVHTALTATCITQADGTCEITITSSTSGSAQLDATYSAQVGDSAAVDIAAPVPATKVWTTFRVTVETDAINVVGNPHTFTVTVEQSNPAGDCDASWCAVAKVFPTIDVTGSAVITEDGNDCEDNGTGADGTCTVTIRSSQVETVVLTATFDASVGQQTASFTNTPGATKSWVDFDLTVDPPTDENLVGTDHVFTVTITTTIPTQDGTQTNAVVGAIPTVSLDGLGAITSNGCAAGTVDDDPLTLDVDEAGTCQVTIKSSAPGSSVLSASYKGTTVDDQIGKTVGDSGDKLWVDYELEITPDAVNRVGDAHTFTATLTVDTGGGFGPAAGETLQFTVDGVGDVIIADGDVDDALACVTNAEGRCTIVINSGEAGATDVAVRYDAVVGDTSRSFPAAAVKQWVAIQLVKTAVTGDGFGDGELIADPGGLPFLAFTSGDRGPKSAVFEYVITNPSNVTLENVVLTDDRLGAIDLTLFPACQVLDPGEVCTARGSEQFDYDDATAALGGPITNIGVVTATGGGETVRDTDFATIGLVAVQSSILIDLVKDVVVGAGDVEEFGGQPTINWSQEEYESGATKTVRYRFVVTNISSATIVDVELIDPMISGTPIIAVADGVTLAPGASTTVEVDYLLTAATAFPDGPTASTLDNVATVSGANETRDSFSDATDDASLFNGLVFAEIIEREPEPEPLPATGFGGGGLLPVSMLLIAVGVAVLWLDRRRFASR